MGENISDAHFSQDAFQDFDNRLASETNWLIDQPVSKGDTDCYTCGFEIEGWLLDTANTPAPINDIFINQTNTDGIVPELSKFNFEINTNPRQLSNHCFRLCESEIAAKWLACNQAAENLNKRCMLIGTMPNTSQSIFNLANMSDENRYHALNEQLIRLRSGKPAHILIHGEDTLDLERQDVMLESAATSFQVHLQSPSALINRTFNAAIALSAITVSINANAPYLFGKDLWAESRIPLFEQSVAVNPDHVNSNTPRVTFGSGYIKKSIEELFIENQKKFKIVLPELYDTPKSSLKHLSLHNGTIWRWNRPLVTTTPDGLPEYRLEHRVISAGPTVADMIATAALFYGAAIGLANEPTPIEALIPFKTAKDNFYHAAKNGLTTSIIWKRGERESISDIVCHELIPLATEALVDIGMDRNEVDYYLNLISERVHNHQTGAQWQHAFMTKHNDDWPTLTESYYQNQQSGKPVHTWAI